MHGKDEGWTCCSLGGEQQAGPGLPGRREPGLSRGIPDEGELGDGGPETEVAHGVDPGAGPAGEGAVRAHPLAHTNNDLRYHDGVCQNPRCRVIVIVG